MILRNAHAVLPNRALARAGAKDGGKKRMQGKAKAKKQAEE
jgi:hypothetical protein